jgi:O-antigen/teichoic acid export membrane protein
VLKRLLVHMSAYTLGNLLVTLAGFISFPIFSRLFTVPEYGILNLISATLGLLVAVGKLGTQHATVRFYGEVVAGKRAIEPKEFYSTVVFGMAGTGFAFAVVWAGASQLIPARWWNHQGIQELLLLSSVLVFIRVADSGIMNLLRAQQRSGLFNAYSVIKRYVELAIVLVMVLRILPGLTGFYLGTIAAEALATATLFLVWRHYFVCTPSRFSLGLYRAMLAYGLPMVGAEMGSILLSLGDRYVLQVMLGGNSLGLYAAAYNLCEYVRAVVVMSLGQAVFPIYVRLWEEKGEAETAKFVQQAVHFYVLLAAAIVAGLSAVGDGLLTFLASEKYRAGAQIIPYVVGGMVIDGVWPLLCAGLFIHKQTRVVAKAVAVCVVLNLGLNVALVPTFGIQGAAFATLLSYMALAVLGYRAGRRGLRTKVPWGSIAKFALFALVMYLAVSLVHAPTATTTLVAKVFVGVVVYGTLAFLFDRVVRDAGLSLWARLRSRT